MINFLLNVLSYIMSKNLFTFYEELIMLTISKEIKNIEKTFKKYFNKNKPHFNYDNIQNTTISILGLLHVFSEKQENYKNKINQYNEKYDEIISELPVHYCNECQVCSIIHFYNEDFKFYEFDCENYEYLSNSNEIVSLADKILTVNKVDKNFKHYEYFKKIAIFIVIKYFIEHERTKSEIAIGYFFNNNYNIYEFLAEKIIKSFKNECDILYGNIVNNILIENAIYEVDDRIFLKLTENNENEIENDDSLKFSLIQKSINLKKLDRFSDNFIKNHSIKYDHKSVELFKKIMFHIFNEIVKFR